MTHSDLIRHLSRSFRITACLLLGGFSLPHLSAQNRTWSAGTGGTDFNNGSNYSPTGTLAGTDNLIFETETSAALDLDAGLGINSVVIDGGADGFILSSANASGLTVNSGGITVAASTEATFNVRINANGGATQMTFDVGTGGTLNANGLVVPFTKAFYKTGAGLLYLDQGMGTNAQNHLRTGASINIEEGTLEVGNSARFEPGTGFVGTLMVNVGTVDSAATLKGGGSFVGVASKPVVLNTFGVSQSFLEPAGDGTLAIENLNAAAGATFRFDLGSDLIFGTGTLTGSSAAGGMTLDLSGGTTGVLYTLFQYGSLSGVDVSDFAITNPGYSVDFWDISGGEVKVQFSSVIPEPGYVGLMLLVGLAQLMKRSPRRRGVR